MSNIQALSIQSRLTYTVLPSAIENEVIHDIELAEEFDILFRPKRFKVFYGGRGGLKSWGFAQALELIGHQEKTRILCTRELQGSIRESVHRLLSDTSQSYRHGLLL